MNYVAHSTRLEELRALSPTDRDEQYENNLIIMQLFLLYEELSYAMNAGDIGRVEKCLEACMFIFKATGKHKYATEIIRHFTNVHSFYPDSLEYSMPYTCATSVGVEETEFSFSHRTNKLLNFTSGQG